MSRLTEPTNVGFLDVNSPSLRIYYPALPPGGAAAPVVPLDNRDNPYRPVIAPFVTGSGISAVQSRWQEPFTGSSGETVLGRWPAGTAPWRQCATLTFSPTPLVFGVVPTGTVATRVLSIRNASGNMVTLSFPASGGPFKWASFNGTLGPNEERSAPVTGALTITSTAFGSPHTIGMTGKGTGGFPVPA